VHKFDQKYAHGCEIFSHRSKQDSLIVNQPHAEAGLSAFGRSWSENKRTLYTAVSSNIGERFNGEVIRTNEHSHQNWVLSNDL
jgi:hypothetical protein